MPIKPFLKNAVFGPDAISVMGIAFVDVCNFLETSGRSDIPKENIAAIIIQLAQRNETDPIVLREMTLSQLGLSRLPE